MQLHREGGISEIVGFVLILAVIVTVVALYLTYGVPNQGREGEISHMNEVKDRFVEYKVNIDSLWSNRQCGTAIATSFSLGTRGGATTGSYSIIPILSPAKSSGTLALNQRAEYITIASDSLILVSSGGFNESGSINFTFTTPATPVSVITFNSTPAHFLITVNPISLYQRMGVNVTNSNNRWSAWVNVTPVNTTSWVFNLTRDQWGRVQTFGSTLTSLWNRTDITISTMEAGLPVISGMTVFQNVTTNTNYTVDLVNPAYGISADLASPQTLYAYRDNYLGAWFLTNYSYWNQTPTPQTLLMGSLEYRAQNEYWINQTYYYQMGGVFLQQGDGNTVKIPPTISFSNVGGTPVVKVNRIILSGSGIVTGSGPAQVTSSVTNITQTPLITGNNTRFVNISVLAADTNAALMWQRIFQTLADQAGFSPSSYTNASVGNASFINISPSSSIYGVQLALNRVNVGTALQSAAPGSG